MFEKKYYQNLNTLRNKIKISSRIEMQEIDYVLKWLKKRNSENKMKIKKIKVNELKDWSSDSGGNLFHKSKQFFGVMGIKVASASAREVVSWDQPILTQKLFPDPFGSGKKHCEKYDDYKNGNTSYRCRAFNLPRV